MNEDITSLRDQWDEMAIEQDELLAQIQQLEDRWAEITEAEGGAL